MTENPSQQPDPEPDDTPESEPEQQDAKPVPAPPTAGAEADLTELLRTWPMTPGQINARYVNAADGRVLIQVRVDLGVLQMERDHRPDGVPHDGAPTLLHALEARMEAYERNSGSSHGFVLTSHDCRLLRQEAMQVYHRYVALFALTDFERVIRDTLHNLRIADLCRDFGETESDQTVLEQFRPQLILMRRRAEAEHAVKAGNPDGALAAIDAGIDELSTFYQEHSDRYPADILERSSEILMLRGMRDALVPRLPMSQRAELEERLQSALDAENYELAAILRDELRMM